MKPILILSGPVGAGKSEVARELVKSAPSACANIEGDTFWSFIARPAPGVPRNESFRMIMRSMISASMAFALADYETILDFSMPPWFMKTACAVARFKEVDLDYVILRPSESVCAARAANRTEGAIADYAKYHELYTAFDEAKPHIICDDASDAKAIAARIRDEVTSGKFRIA